MKLRAWQEKFRKYGIHLSVSREGRCSNCGMMISDHTHAHGSLFGPMCHRSNPKGPWKYSITAHAAGMQLDTKTLPSDLLMVAKSMRAQSGRECRSIWLNLEEDGTVFSSNREETV